jgi:hypothetical protein
MVEGKLYRKARKEKALQKKQPRALDFIDNSFKVNMNFNMIKNGANVNEVFKINPCGLDSFLTGVPVAANKQLKGTITRVDIPAPKIRYMGY